MRPDGVSNSGIHFLIGYVISVRETEQFAETSHLECLYPSFNVCCCVYVSHAYKNMDMARERTSLILELRAIFLSFQMIFSLVIAAVVWAILDSASGLDPPSDTIAPRCLKLQTVSSFFVVSVSADAIGFFLFVCLFVFWGFFGYQLGLLCTDLHTICCGGLFKVIYQLLLLSS